MKIVVVDYGLGNVQSIFNALNQVENINIVLSDKKDEILSADGVVLPGVGAFKKAMQELNKRNLPNILEEYISTNKPFLGICLGMQLLFECSDEYGKTSGLGFIKGQVVSFPSSVNDKLPHVSWNEIYKQKINWDNTILKNIINKDSFYFVHSYICKPKNKDITLSTTEYGGVEFCSSIQVENIYACQFHPEKSAKSGIQVIKNFIEVIKG